MTSSHIADIGMPDEADTLLMSNKPEIEALWHGVVAAACTGGGLAKQRDEGLWGELQWIARLLDAVTTGSNDPDDVWFRFLEGKGIRRTQQRGRRRPLFYGLIEHLSNEHASPDETRSKSIISRRAAVLQHWHDQERDKVPADQVAEWIATKGGVNAVAAIASPPKPPMTKAERKTARDKRQVWAHQLAERGPLTTMNWGVLPDNLRRFADGTFRLALIRIRKTDADDGAVDIIGMAADSQVSQRWLNQNAQGIVEPLKAARPDCEAAEDRVGVIGDDSATIH